MSETKTIPLSKKERDRRYYLKHRGQILIKKNAYRNANKELFNERARNWYQKNKGEKLRKQKSDYEKNRRITDTSYRLAHNLRSRLRSALKGNRNGSATKDLGCSIEELRIYLESKFQPGMSWENYGEWHIDHIFPLSKADLSDREQFLKVCHYTNLQPLWAIDNKKKKDRIEV